MDLIAWVTLSCLVGVAANFVCVYTATGDPTIRYDWRVLTFAMVPFFYPLMVAFYTVEEFLFEDRR